MLKTLISGRSIGRSAMVRAIAAIALASAGSAALAAPACPNRIGAVEEEAAIHAVQNLMGRYSHLLAVRGDAGVKDLFALKTEGVSWRTPGGPVGIAEMHERFAHPQEDIGPGVLRMHAMLSPVIEVAGDGKTAKGVWDSFGPQIGGESDVGSWMWIKYAVDFIKEDGEWKIWHLQIAPIFFTPYDKSITQSARDRRAHPTPLPPQFTKHAPPDLWMYDGVTPPKGPYIPEPYCTFDPRTAY